MVLFMAALSWQGQLWEIVPELAQGVGGLGWVEALQIIQRLLDSLHILRAASDST
jgi:hypothetical protein